MLQLESLSTFFMLTLWATFTTCVPSFVRLLLSLFFRESELETNLRKQVTELKTELGTINMTQEFAKYAKIQRKINKMSEELKNQGNAKNIYKLKVQAILYVIIITVVTICSMYVLWSNRYKPIMFVNTSLIYPLASILSFPTGVEGAISATSWFSSVTFTSRYIKKRLLT